MLFIFLVNYFFIYIIDTVSSTVQSTIDSGKSVAGSVCDKSVSLVSGAKGTCVFVLLEMRLKTK